jgi:hypothetical protein
MGGMAWQELCIHKYGDLEHLQPVGSEDNQNLILNKRMSLKALACVVAGMSS